MTDWLDGRKWKFLDNPQKYAEGSGLEEASLIRQFKAAKEILRRFQPDRDFPEGRGVLLADDVGLGKTTVGALVAWVFACHEKMRVRIYAPNKVMQRRWAEELERHVPMLKRLGARSDRIKQWGVEKLKAGRIEVTTHYALVQNRDRQLTGCDLMIIDEAHRAKGEGSEFNKTLNKLGNYAKRKLILTATPFSIEPDELAQLLGFVGGATKFEAVHHYAKELKELYRVTGGDVDATSKKLVDTARAAVEELQPYLIRHGINDLAEEERELFGEVADKPWKIESESATQQDLELLLRMDRLLQLSSDPEQKKGRRNDPRFHVGWQQVDTALKEAEAGARADAPIAFQHIEAARTALDERLTKRHPKIGAVIGAVRQCVDRNEKVLVFCHHHATASELLTALEGEAWAESALDNPPSEAVWRDAWQLLLLNDESLVGIDDSHLVPPIINWLCTPGLRAQIGGWIGEPAGTVEKLKKQLEKTRPRNAKAGVPTILASAKALIKDLTNEQSKSTRGVLESIIRQTDTFAGQFPGRLDEHLPVMGAWSQDDGDRPATLYSGEQPDIVVKIFNSPFGPDVLVTTDRLSEGVDLHHCCRHLIHYELDPSPVRTLQRNGRVRRVGSWASQTNQPIEYAYPIFRGTRDEKAVSIMKQRIEAFGLLLGGVPTLEDDSEADSFVEKVLSKARRELEDVNKRLCDL